MFSQFTLILALVASASAHMILDFPKPFGRASLTSSPLELQDFPCKQRPGAYMIDLGMNQWNAGETKNVSINGTAVHGGGSCQFSLTTDPEPDKNSQWKVIHSVIGNCLTTIMDNFEDLSIKEPFLDPLLTKNATDVPVTMPSDIPDGRYTFAWSWLNKIGNREFYMNCAPIQVGSDTSTANADSAAKVLSALPDMFVTNIPGNDKKSNYCMTEGMTDFVYPNPGKSVVRGSSTNITFSDFSKNKGPGCDAQKVLGAGAGKLGGPNAYDQSTEGSSPSPPSQGTAPSTPSQSTTPSKPSSAPSMPVANPPSKASGAPSKPSISQKPVASPDSGSGYPQQSKIPSNPNGGQFAPIASSTLAAVPTPQPSAPAAAQPAPATPQTPSDNNTTPANGDCTPCTNEGGVVCIGSKQFGLCNRGCAVAQDLAAGMACTGGAVVASTKRHVHFPRGHLHRRFTAAHVL